MRVISITVDCSLICLARLEELERNVNRTLVVVGDTAAEPLSVLLALTCYHYILARLSKEVL